MYEDLVKRLRKHYDEHCPLDRASGICGGVLANEAADAIEELTGFVQEAERDRDEYRERLDKANDAIEELSKQVELEHQSGFADGQIAANRKKLRWIPVTERLPGKGKYVLVRYKNNDMAVACLFDWDEDILFWRAMTDEGWCADCDTEPTHWMPLPEPPKEEI